MIAAILFGVFIVLMLIGVPVGVALGLGGTVAIVLSNLDTPWYGLLTVPQNFYAGLAKYPLLAIPMFVLVGSIFDRSGVAKRLVDFAIAIVGRGPACCRWCRSPWPCSWAASPALVRPAPPPWAR